MDVLTPAQRHKCMSNIKSKNTKPELIVRTIAHNLGYRFRLHRKDLPGKPDLIFPRHKKVIFVNGCFWHMHRCKYGIVVPKTNRGFWQSKRKSNVIRDKKNKLQLKKSGWDVLIIWECWTKNPDRIVNQINRFMSK